MKAEETQILVVGAGPAGLIAAREAAYREAEVTVLEEDAEIGYPCHCAGLLSIRGLEKINVPSTEDFVQNKVRGAHFFSPSGLSFKVDREEPVACVVDRRLFDKFLARQATKAGVQLRLNSKVKNIRRTDTAVVVRHDEKSISANVIVDAEGVSSRIVKAVGLKPLDSACLLPGLQFDLEGVDVDADYVEVHVGRKVAPGFFAWVIPLSEDSARVGLGCKEANPAELLGQFVKDRFESDRSLERVATRSGRIVTCGPIEKTFSDRFLVVGDAAGQVKPITGGGVILGGICASMAGKITCEAVKHEDFTGAFLERYERLWRKELGKEFNTAFLARRVMNHLSDVAVDKLFEVVVKENLQGLLSAEGDMDLQRGVLLKLTKRREVLAVLPSFLRAFSPFTKE